LPVFDEIGGMTMDLVFFIRETLIKIANTPLDRSATLVLSILNVLQLHCQIHLEIWPELDLGGK